LDDGQLRERERKRERKREREREREKERERESARAHSEKIYEKKEGILKNVTIFGVELITRDALILLAWADS
jgi:hypothetical protein